jgi:hypothetical protein
MNTLVTSVFTSLFLGLASATIADAAPSDADALAFAKTLLGHHSVTCVINGKSRYFQANYNYTDGLILRDGSLHLIENIFELSDVDYKQTNYSLSTADRLNNIDYSGAVAIVAQAHRLLNRQTKTWGIWQSPEDVEERVFFIHRNGQWEEQAPLPAQANGNSTFDCSTVESALPPAPAPRAPTTSRPSPVTPITVYTVRKDWKVFWGRKEPWCTVPAGTPVLARDDISNVAPGTCPPGQRFVDAYMTDLCPKAVPPAPHWTQDFCAALSPP